MKNNSDVIAVVGSKRSPIILRLNEYEGRRTVDLRRYFFLEGTDEPKPTQKGVSLNRETFALIQSALTEHADEIADWLQPGSSASTMAARGRAVQDLRVQARPFAVANDSWKSPVFFQAAAEGGADRFGLNSFHPFSRALDEFCSQIPEALGNLIRDYFAEVLISYYRSKMLFDGAAEMKPEDVFETLEMNWGLILKRYFVDRSENE